MRKGIVFALMFTLAGTAFASESDNVVAPATIEKLNRWLDAQTEFEQQSSQPQIKLIGAQQAENLRGVADRSGGRVRGLYDAQSRTIYLAAPWNPDNPRDLSVLLHEMVHHRQATQHWYCEQAQEWRAYQIQAQWLAERQIADDFYWPAILLQSSCAKRDIHPE